MTPKQPKLERELRPGEEITIALADIPAYLKRHHLRVHKYMNGVLTVVKDEKMHGEEQVPQKEGDA